MIISFSQLIEKQYSKDLDEEGLTYLQFMSDGAYRMNQLIRDLLLYSRINRTEEPVKQVDCNSVLKVVLQDLQPSIVEKKAVVHIEKLPVVTAKYSEMTRLFQNFISNALKFSSDKRPHISVKTQEQTNSFLFSITDNGIGIDEDYFNKIFTIFKRLHSREQYKGTGVGLAICKKIVENWGGKIWVESQKGVGSTFYFTVPK